MKKNVIFVTQTPEFGGAEKHLVDLIRRIDDHVPCVVVCFSEDFYSETLKQKRNVQVVRLPIICTDKFRSFLRVFRQHRAHVIVLVKGIFDHYPLSAYLAARVSGARRLVVLEHLIPDPPPGPEGGSGPLGLLKQWFGWRSRFLLARKLQGRLSHATVCVSEAIRRRLTQEYGYPEEQTITVRNGIDLGYFIDAQREASRVGGRAGEEGQQPLTIVCAARLSFVKRLDLLLDALHLLGQSHTNWRCLILGTGPLRDELIAQARHLSLLDRVSFVGQVPDVKPYLTQADLFVLSSEKEGLPLALLEAMAAGVPAVVTDVGGTGEVVVHGKNGLLVKSGSVEELERAMAYLLVHHEERCRMGKAAARHMQDHFNIEESMGRLKQVVLCRDW